MCGRSFDDCPHSVSDVDAWFDAAVTRASLNALVNKIQKDARAEVTAALSTKTQGDRVMGIVSEHHLRDTLAAIRSGSEDLAATRLRVFAESVFTNTCDDLKDIVAGRMVNKGVDAEVAREAAVAIEEYMNRVRRG
jgi:hypothetical protein